MPASDDYYADQNEGIAVRWNKGNEHDYKILSKKDVKAMSPEEIEKLSAPEKLDIYLGDYSNIPTQGFGLTRRVKRQSKDHGEERNWEGICHGWTSSGINNTEPMPVTLKNKDGIEVRFGSSDVKALLSYSYTSRSKSGYTSSRQVGQRCNVQKLEADKPIPESCKDLNPGAFHVVLLNQIAIKKQAFITDVDNSGQVWNQPVSGYKILSIEDVASYPEMSPQAKSAQKIQLIMEYVAEVNPQWEPVVGTSRQRIEGRAYEYYIDLNAAGEIVGGKWLRYSEVRKTMNSDGTPSFQTDMIWWKPINHIGALQHPDFFWIADPAPCYGIWKTFMNEVYKPRQFD